MEKQNFEQMGIHPSILRSLKELGYTEPTEIQQKSIPFLGKSSNDFFGLAQTGTGKTAAFLIPLLQKLDLGSSDLQAIILAPTRELATQVEFELSKLSKYLEVKSTCIFGGVSYDKQIQALKKYKPQIVVGTPGRTIDLINKNILKLSSVKFCILDEADEMLNMGFLEDVEFILGKVSSNSQVIMFSATMPRQIEQLLEKSFKDYHSVKTSRSSLKNEQIEQAFFMVKERYFKDALLRVIEAADDFYGIVFCRTKIETVQVGDFLVKSGESAIVLNGDMKQIERDRAISLFKGRKKRILVCTDVAARGLDVEDLSHVINYGLPQDNDSYVHRIGRTGRAGKEGLAYTLVSAKQAFVMKKLEQHTKGKITLQKIPNIESIKKKKFDKEMESLYKIKDSILDKGEDFKLDHLFEDFQEKMKDLKKNDLLKLLFTSKFNKLLKASEGVSDIEDRASKRDFQDRSKKGRRNFNRRRNSRSR